MTQNRPELGASALTDEASLSAIGRVTARVGAVLLLTAAPLALVTFLVILLDAPRITAGLDAAVTAMSGPLAAGGGVPWLFHAGVLGLLAGCWTLGVGLILSGLGD